MLLVSFRPSSNERPILIQLEMRSHFCGLGVGIITATQCQRVLGRPNIVEVRRFSEKQGAGISRRKIHNTVASTLGLVCKIPLPNLRKVRQRM